MKKYYLIVVIVITASCIYQEDNGIVFVSPGGGWVRLGDSKVNTIDLRTAIAQLKPDAVLQLTPGIYTGSYTIRLRANQNNSVVIRGMGKDTIFNNGSSPGDEKYCLGFSDSSWITVEDIAFRNCWAASIVVDNSNHLAFENLYAEGSRFMIFAQGESTHHLLVENNIWIQDPTGRLWNEIPWEESHHGEYDYFNGGMFSSREILGSVVIRNNTVKNAFNGIRMVGSPGSKRIQNANVEIYDNYFENVRDNPIEPEVSAHNWWIHHNRIKNAHAIFSFTKVSGGDWFVFSNVSWFDQAPGGPTNTSGKIFKFSRTGPYPDKKFYVFNNSWYSRTPLIGSGQSRNLEYWNNAAYFSDVSSVTKKKYLHNSYKGNNNLSNLSIDKDLNNLGHLVTTKDIFLNPRDGDFRLSKSSPAIDAGRIIELYNWRSVFKGNAPDIGAFEGDDMHIGPPFRFDDSGYQEAPRIVQLFVTNLALEIFFSAAMLSDAKTPVSIKLINGRSINLACALNAYNLHCDFPSEIMYSQVLSITLSKNLKGTNGLEMSLWAAPKTNIELLIE